MAVHYRGYNLGGPDDEDISQIEFTKPCSVCNATLYDRWAQGTYLSDHDRRRRAS